MSYDKASQIRQLTPKSYHFDGYSEVNCQNSRDKPFFADSVIPMGEHYLSIRLKNPNTVCLEFSSTCSRGKITFQPYMLTLEEFISKLQEAIKSGRDFIPFEISAQYNSYCYCNNCKYNNEDCRALRKSYPKKVFAAVSFDFNEIKEALAMYFEITNTHTTKGGQNIMKKRNNFFGMNFELGLSKDPNIASTLMGLAVRSPANGNWYVYDATRNTRKNIANVKLGNFPVMYVPVQQYTIGHLYKETDGHFYYAQSINPNGTVTMIGAADGIIREVLPEESLIPGMTLHTEVIAFDANTLMNANSKENVSGNILAAMLMMNWSKGNGAEFSLDSINDDSFNGLGAYLPLILANNGGNLGGMFKNPDGSLNLVMLMALGSDEGGNNDMMQMMVLSQLLGNGNSPLSGIIPGTTPSGSTAPLATATENNLVCEKCGATYPTGTNFCPKCGGKTKPLAKTCRKCGAVLLEGAAFCHKCGAKVGEDVCPKCGRHVEESENFCSACGTPLKAATTAVASAPVVSEAAQVPVPATEPTSPVTATEEVKPEE